MNKAPTLIDSIYRTTFSKERVNGWLSNAHTRAMLMAARRFVLDDAMSEFLAVLSVAAFTPRPQSSRQRTMNARVIEHLRMGARLPHPFTWIEYNLRASMRKRAELRGEESSFNPHEVSEREGWLLVQHPHCATAFELVIFISDDKPDEHGFYAWTFPVAYGWVADDETPMPYRGTMPIADIACGLAGYESDRIALVRSAVIDCPPGQGPYVTGLVKEWAGVLRRVFVLLSTINDLPTLITDVRASKGFVARNDYRKYLHHKTITLTIPAKQYRKVAKNVLAIAHRRAHGVRGHWRKDWRHPLSAFCDHDFSADEKHMECTICKGKKSWITEHQRGDAGRGLVLHDYEVKHEPERKP